MSTKMKLELLPNEIFIACFQYLNSLDIIYSFDQLNYRFYKLIRNISLHLNLHGFKESLFNIYKTMLITSLTIDNCDLNDLFELFKYTPMLKYLKVQHFYDSDIRDDKLNFININIVNLKQFIINHCVAKFKFLELLLNYMINLKIFSISAPSQIEMVDANRWQHLIEASLPHLHVFKFSFCYAATDSYNEKLIKLQQFQTYFWHKQHNWYTNYEISDFLVSIYTMPYIRNEYQLISTMDRYINTLINYPNGFNNVKDLTLWIRTIKNDSSYYFRNVESLTLTSSLDDKSHEHNLTTQIKHLNVIVNLSSIKHLTIEDDCPISSSLLLEILNKLPDVSSLTIAKWNLLSFLNDHQLCESLNKKIIKLDISGNCRNTYIKSNNIDSYCRTSSNVERLQCNMKNLDELLLILSKCLKLSMINLGKISHEIYLWIQLNVSTLNIHFDFIFIDDEDNMTTSKSSEIDLIMDLFFCLILNKYFK